MLHWKISGFENQHSVFLIGILKLSQPLDKQSVSCKPSKNSEKYFYLEVSVAKENEPVEESPKSCLYFPLW